MCGVVAALYATRLEMERATAALSHRGIRHRIEYNDAGAVGHVRLPIVGIGKENDQPRRTKHELIGFVGELLDYKEHAPGMACDTDLVVQQWRVQGQYGFRNHDGFWGIVAVDELDKCLRVLTDYLGQKPMYYRTDRPAAASEPDALKPFGPLTLDKIYLGACIKWGYCPDVRRTPYNEIKHVLPGECVKLTLTPDPVCYAADPIQVSTSADIGLLQKEIELAVKRRVLSSDVPVAALVSGGLDSAITYTLANRWGYVRPYFVSGASDDMTDAEAVLLNSGVDPVQLNRVACSDFDRGHALEIMQEPIDLGSLRPQAALSSVVPERVCLTGDGADELFGGYGRSTRYDSQWTDVFQELPAWHLPRLDRVMMRRKIEVRSPFLARNVVSIALGMPHDLRKDKAGLRMAAQAWLPPSIVTKEKKALRTAEIAHDREANSRMLVDRFVENFRKEQDAQA